MRSTALIKILDETVLETTETFAITVERLMAQQGICYQKDTQNNPLEFTCTRKGKLWVKSPYRSNGTISQHRVFYVRGEVFVQEGKTKVGVYTVHDRSAAFLRWFELLLLVLVTAVYILLDCIRGLPVQALLFMMFFAVVLLITMLSQNKGERKYKNEDLQIMKSEVIRRVEAVNRWDE